MKSNITLYSERGRQLRVTSGVFGQNIIVKKVSNDNDFAICSRELINLLHNDTAHGDYVLWLWSATDNKKTVTGTRLPTKFTFWPIGQNALRKLKALHNLHLLV